MGTIHKITQDGGTIFPATVTDAVVHPDLSTVLTDMITEYNVSILFPTGGTGGTNIYTLTGAIGVLNTNLTNDEKVRGVKVIFYDSASSIKTYYFTGSSYSNFGTESYWKETPDFLGIDDEPTEGSENLVKSGGVAAVNGFYIDDPEFIRVLVDSEKRILAGIKSDGSVTWAKGVPDPVANYIGQQLSVLTNYVKISDLAEVLYKADSISGGVVVLDSQQLSNIDEISVNFTLEYNSFALAFFDSNDQRISYAGLSSGNGGERYSTIVKIPINAVYAKTQWGRAKDFVISKLQPNKVYYDSILSSALDNVPYKIKMLSSWFPSYLKIEMEETISTIDELTGNPALVLPIITDSHMNFTGRGYDTAYENLACLNYIVKNCFSDGIVHLGDTILESVYSTLQSLYGMTAGEADEYCFRVMQDYLMRCSNIHDMPLIVNGNHDGTQANLFHSKKWYSMIGRKLQAIQRIKMSGNAPYFYVDYPKCNVRCIFLSVPDSDNDANPVYGMSSNQLNWFANTALDVDNGTNVIIFCHIAPFSPDFNSSVNDFYRVCNAFNSHSSYSGSGVICDFTSKNNCKILVECCGHSHGEKIFQSGDSYTYNGIEYVNQMPCPVVMLTNSYNDGRAEDVTDSTGMGLLHVARIDKTDKQCAFDTLVYRPDENKIYFIRFGSGSDRYVNV